MAVVAPSSSETLDPKSDQSDPKSTPPSVSTPNPNPNPPLPPPPSAPSFTPTFRPQYPNPSLQPPGVAPPVPIAFPGAMQSAPPGAVYYPAPGQPPGRPYWSNANGYVAQNPGLIPPPGLARYPGQYAPMVRVGFPPRPPMPVGVIPPLSRPQVPGVSGLQMVPPVVRPIVPIIAPTEKPQTTVYVGKIASSAENDFLLSLLRLCGPVKSWKRAQDPSDGTPRGFGFCEFESAEGVLRALRLLTKLNIDGQELVLNVNQATREYLERYVEKKTEREKLKSTGDDGVNKENESQEAEKQEPPTENENSHKETDKSEDTKKDDPQKFGLVSDEDRDADKEALDKLKNMIEERLKAKPLPPPPPVSASADGTAKTSSEPPTKSRDGDSDGDIVRNAEDRNEEDITSGNKPSTEPSSSDKGRRRDRSRERDRERDSKRDKERELERYERDRERERVRRERERELKTREIERRYKDRVKEWEAREREKEYQRQYEREREKDRESKRRREIMDQEDESDDDDIRKRRHRGSAAEDKRRKMQREKEEDLADRLKEEEEIAEAKERAFEEQRRKDDAKMLAASVSDGTNGDEMQDDKMHVDDVNNFDNETNEVSCAAVDNAGDGNISNGISDESNMGSISMVDPKQSNSNLSRKLGFGLIGSGKRTSVPSVFHEEDEDVEKDKKMRPLVPIEYTTEELQAVQTTIPGTSPNLVAAAEFAKRIGTHKDERAELERDRRRSSDKHRDRDRDRSEGSNKHSRNENREKVHDKISERDKNQEDKPKATENKKLLDAKQLIDMIPKTKEELFSYEINWSVYDKHQLHERMRPWISKKITEFLGEEEATFVDYIVSCTKDHVKATEMLQLLQPILDEEAEMFVLKMWRMLIFEIKKVESGLSMKSKA